MSMYAEDPMSMMGGGAAPEAEASGLDASDQEILNLLQDKLRAETDSARQAAMGKIIADLAKLLADDEDAQMSAMGGNPKQLRAVARAQQ